MDKHRNEQERGREKLRKQRRSCICKKKKEIWGEHNGEWERKSVTRMQEAESMNQQEEKTSTVKKRERMEGSEESQADREEMEF